jgi:hypothetical protein
VAAVLAAVPVELAARLAFMAAAVVRERMDPPELPPVVQVQQEL